MIFLWILFVYVVAGSAGYLVHKVLHKKWSGMWYAAHTEHHNVLYPPNNFFSKKYREPSRENQQGKFYLLPAAVILCLIFYFAPLLWACIAAAEIAAIAWLNDRIHAWMHIERHWLGHFRWFRYLREKHYIHHVRQETNYGIFSFIGDRILGTSCSYEDLTGQEKKDLWQDLRTG